MHPRIKPLSVLLLILCTACGNEHDPRLSNDDIMYIKMQRLQQIYSVTVTATATNTVTTCLGPPPTANMIGCVQGMHGVWDVASCRWTCR